ncbi:MAG: transporter substrate-binding domain-containing protein [Alphaproteobacteria bacterium]|nr:transporter substrate-binding domain-containing protein [Alphaproteobacteria bacterium]
MSAESAFDRATRTKTLRCGYILYDPVVRKNPNNGALSGILVDALNEIGKRLEWKIEWTEELSFITQFEGLRTGRYDLVCTALWGFPEQAKAGEFIGPFYYEPIGIWARSGDTRFDKDWSKINDPDVIVSGVDGTFPAQEAKAVFPQAKLRSLPQSSDYASPLMDVATGKADVTFINNSMGLAFDSNNPGKIRNIATGTPFRVFPIYVITAKGEFKLQSLMNNMLNLMHNDQSMARILRQYEKIPGSYYPVAKPYEVVR